MNAYQVRYKVRRRCLDALTTIIVISKDELCAIKMSDNLMEQMTEEKGQGMKYEIIDITKIKCDLSLIEELSC